MERIYALMVKAPPTIIFSTGGPDFHLAVSRRRRIHYSSRSTRSSGTSSAVMVGIVGPGPSDGLFYHRRILDAIIARDAAAAERIMREQVVRSIERLRTKAQWREDHPS